MCLTKLIVSIKLCVGGLNPASRPPTSKPLALDLRPVKAANSGTNPVLLRLAVARNAGVLHRQNSAWLLRNAPLASGKELLDNQYPTHYSLICNEKQDQKASSLFTQ